jgi:hypothetical protein
MRYIMLCLLFFICACSRWDALPDKPIPAPKIIAAYTMCDFNMCFRLLNQHDVISLNRMICEGRCLIVAARAFEPTIIPTEEQNYIYGILYPQEEYVFVNKDAFLSSPTRVLGK